MNPGRGRSHDLTRYQGRSFLHLLLAICIPAGILYLRLVLGLAATDTRVTSAQSTWLNRAAILALIVFFAVQLICARYIQQLLKLRQTAVGKFLQYVAVLLMCIFFSLTGAIMLEAFGFNLFLRVGGVR